MPQSAISLTASPVALMKVTRQALALALALALARPPTLPLPAMPLGPSDLPSVRFLSSVLLSALCSVLRLGDKAAIERLQDSFIAMLIVMFAEMFILPTPAKAPLMLLCLMLYDSPSPKP